MKAEIPISPGGRAFPLAFGTFLAVALLKFGNPPVMEKMVSPPADIYEFILGTPWPVAWATYLLAITLGVGLFSLRFSFAAPKWLLALPLAWFGWQVVAAVTSINPELTNLTLRHFALAVTCFYLGAFSLRGDTRWFWAPLLLAFTLVLAIGFSQHFGGLEETRRYFYLYIYPQLKEVPPEYLKKISSNRIFSTLFYPNSLAGALLLLVGPILSLLLTARAFTTAARLFLSGGFLLATLACLYWSGSKAGWLLVILLALVYLIHLPVPKRIKTAVIALVLLGGISGFFLRYAGFFQAGATSVVARFDYWQAALATAQAHPVMGTGPGTFGKVYHQVKRPDAEPTRLTHNDFLQQASDSGIPGFLLYLGFVAGALTYAYPRLCERPPVPPRSRSLLEFCEHPWWHRFAVWAGLLIWFLQGMVEFGLYVPGNAWPAFALLGWLLGTRNCSVDKSAPV